MTTVKAALADAKYKALAVYRDACEAEDVAYYAFRKLDRATIRLEKRPNTRAKTMVKKLEQRSAALAEYNRLSKERATAYRTLDFIKDAEQAAEFGS